MNLVQILLPLHDAKGTRFPQAMYDAVARELTDRFGGLTAYVRAPAAGLWEADSGETRRDDIVVYEVMVGDLDEAWWKGYRESLERAFRQDELVVRAQDIRRL
ncbi:MAG TPA: hypothetical protein VFK48_03960 [Usitatibacter sp.]|nr:hypothetical protein [Usitatibacter sp.]